MKLKNLILVFLFLLASIAPSLATDQPLSDRVVGFWTSSSGTPISLAYSGSSSSFLVQIQIHNQPTQDYVATWNDPAGKGFTYISKAGHKIVGFVDSNNSILVTNPATNWHATWTRNR